jgi:glutamine amidotransferase
MITIVDYQMGNLRSVQKALERVGSETRITGDPEQIATAEKLVLPGVGAFGDAMHELKVRDIVPAIGAFVRGGRPFLGICLGLQLLFDSSDEGGNHEGLGIIPGKVVRFDGLAPELKVPHMGWNTLEHVQSVPILDAISSESHFYFVHSHYVVPAAPEVVAAKTTYGTSFCAMICHENVMATQFHPEKSQQVGLQMLSNFAAL